jgi:TRAP-type C4-dicarboxylate transport system substrate-binding protein
MIGEMKMLISKNTFKKLSKEDQERYLYTMSSLYERKAEKQAIEYTERVAYRYRSDLTGMELVEDVKKNFKIENHGRYEMCIEDIEDYSNKLEKILSRLERS